MNLEESIEMTLKGCEVELYDIVSTREHDKNIFRVFITSKDGISLDKCAEVSRLISPILDVEEPMGGKYFLEVSSPGIERKLKKTQHFIASVGENIRIKDFDKNIIKGKLIAANDAEVTVKTDEAEEVISFDDISSASTYFEW